MCEYKAWKTQYYWVMFMPLTTVTKGGREILLYLQSFVEEKKILNGNKNIFRSPLHSNNVMLYNNNN